MVALFPQCSPARTNGIDRLARPVISRVATVTRPSLGRSIENSILGGGTGISAPIATSRKWPGSTCSGRAPRVPWSVGGRSAARSTPGPRPGSRTGCRFGLAVGSASGCSSWPGPTGHDKKVPPSATPRGPVHAGVAPHQPPPPPAIPIEHLGGVDPDPLVGAPSTVLAGPATTNRHRPE